MSVLIVYDGWQQRRFRDVVGVIVGPVLAIFLSHLFAATILRLPGSSLSASIRWLAVLGAASLGYWGGVAGRRSGMSGLHLVLAVAAGLVIGAPVLALDVFLQPGQVVSGAAGQGFSAASDCSCQLMFGLFSGRLPGR
jgi:hypothetical protein